MTEEEIDTVAGKLESLEKEGWKQYSSYCTYNFYMENGPLLIQSDDGKNFDVLITLKSDPKWCSYEENEIVIGSEGGFLAKAAAGLEIKLLNLIEQLKSEIEKVRRLKDIRDEKENE